MKIKCIAIGNRIMGDDGIGIKVLENLSQELEKEKIQVIFGETDIDYSLSKIDDEDLLFIIDSTYFNIAPGTVTFTPIEKAMKRQGQIYSQHQPSLIDLLNTYKKSVKGYIVGIEVEKIHFSLDLSETLRKKFLSICEEIHKFIYQVIRGS
ncbi:hydrogenase maturation protease [Inediibacterium massiliense]|uniref:hydrogenase maturation protease n=1 Tax=Inediibacterium massiliense TaxID=1658111 RepID=UPI0006B56220|nr:hydrogenase maturation protease [Inediibacterium massiliense]